MNSSATDLKRYRGTGLEKTQKEMGWFRLALLCSLVVVLTLCMVVEGRLGCNTGAGCLNPKTTSADNGRNKVSKEAYRGFRPLGPRVGWDSVGSDLRVVPSGPDPLHHNGSPKKPQTP